MNKIGVENFRRFRQKQELEYGNITFFVGRNNSGKSSVVKALLLVYRLLKLDNPKKISFGNEILEHLNIVTFGRARNSNSKSDIVRIWGKHQELSFRLVFTGEDDKMEARISELSLEDPETKITFTIDPNIGEVSIQSYKEVDLPEEKEFENETAVKDVTKTLLDLQEEMKFYEKSSREYIERLEILRKVQSYTKKLIREDHLKQSNQNILKEEFKIRLNFQKDNFSIRDIIYSAIEEVQSMTFQM
jgi:AAA15 family ATPase/GTPase